MQAEGEEGLMNNLEFEASSRPFYQLSTNTTYCPNNNTDS
jgi:hypothetical protein